MRRTVLALFQTGVHLPHGVKYNAARMKGWPQQEVPANFKFTEEQRFRTKSMPRDTGRIARDFLLSVLYRHQPCEVSALWEHCMSDPQIVLDSKKHLRDVLQQARAEGFVSFEQEPLSRRWVCHLTRERYEEVRGIVNAKMEATEQYSGMRGAAASETADYAAAFQEMNEEAKREHAALLARQVELTSQHLRKFQRTEIDYLPYTDLNGKVNFMWWYETVDAKEQATLPAGGASPEANPNQLDE
ncbi:hypothetical protein STCU_03953 [Strigomonas culicis]|uniref:Uncharacterized protein n=1 Tax=Strigomonas culicis TaxID=28005 RepID=S9UIN1_9TRYP|nr:hypothetical protein STCU_03953 [Strigomonas culicis]|eukprot:EPY30667.1 hypothetical protein STCU_03953 [Strigomonas culicis]